MLVYISVILIIIIRYHVEVNYVVMPKASNLLIAIRLWPACRNSNWHAGVAIGQESISGGTGTFTERSYDDDITLVQNVTHSFINSSELSAGTFHRSVFNPIDEHWTYLYHFYCADADTR